MPEYQSEPDPMKLLVRELETIKHNMDQLLNAVAQSGSCQTCGVPGYWVKTKSGARFYEAWGRPHPACKGAEKKVKRY